MVGLWGGDVGGGEGKCKTNNVNVEDENRRRRRRLKEGRRHARCRALVAVWRETVAVL